MPKPWINLVVACVVVLVASQVVDHSGWPGWIEFPLVALIGAVAYMISARVLIYFSSRRNNPAFLREPSRIPRHRN